jgi:hypothetical protein
VRGFNLSRAIAARPSTGTLGRNPITPPATIVKSTAYFAAVRQRADRAVIRDEWIESAIRTPVREHVQSDGRIRRWAQIPEMEGRYLRVVLLPDGETVHNAFFDRRFQP